MVSFLPAPVAVLVLSLLAVCSAAPASDSYLSQGFTNWNQANNAQNVDVPGAGTYTFPAPAAVAPRQERRVSGPYMLKDIAYEFRYQAAIACDRQRYLIAEATEVFDVTKPKGEGFESLCPNGYFLFRREPRGWYIINKDKECVEGNDLLEKLAIMLNNYVTCPPAQ